MSTIRWQIFKFAKCFVFRQQFMVITGRCLFKKMQGTWCTWRWTTTFGCLFSLPPGEITSFKRVALHCDWEIGILPWLFPFCISASSDSYFTNCTCRDLRLRRSHHAQAAVPVNIAVAKAMVGFNFDMAAVSQTNQCQVSKALMDLLFERIILTNHRQLSFQLWLMLLRQRVSY